MFKSCLMGQRMIMLMGVSNIQNSLSSLYLLCLLELMFAWPGEKHDTAT